MGKKKPTEHAEGQPFAAAAEEGEAETAPTAEDAAAASRQEALAACQEEARQNWDHYLRARADLENYRKRAQREKEELSRFANENLIREILPVIDNLSRALDHARQSPGSNEGVLQGVDMTLNMLHKALERFGAVPFTSLGEAFDPGRHEALGQTESSEYPPNSVAQELQKGYLLNERILRPALVMVAKAPAADTDVKA